MCEGACAVLLWLIAVSSDYVMYLLFIRARAESLIREDTFMHITMEICTMSKVMRVTCTKWIISVMMCPNLFLVTDVSMICCISFSVLHIVTIHWLWGKNCYSICHRSAAKGSSSSYILENFLYTSRNITCRHFLFARRWIRKLFRVQRTNHSAPNELFFSVFYTN